MWRNKGREKKNEVKRYKRVILQLRIKLMTVCFMEEKMFNVQFWFCWARNDCDSFLLIWTWLSLKKTASQKVLLSFHLVYFVFWWFTVGQLTVCGLQRHLLVWWGTTAVEAQLSLPPRLNSKLFCVAGRRDGGGVGRGREEGGERRQEEGGRGERRQ